MIIKGTSRAGPKSLAAHLGNAEKNEKVSLLETRGTVANDLSGALKELDAYGVGTRCEKPLYHAAISPEPPHRLTEQQRNEAIDLLEEKMGLKDHARVVVMHEKQGREHIHVVWSRIDLEHNRSVSDSHNYRKHEEVARELERRFGHDRVQGALHERDGVERPDRTPSRADLRQEERTGITGKQVKAEVTGAFKSSDGAEAFKAALEDRGYVLAQGDKRDFVVVDRAGGIHSLARRIDGVRAADLREFMKPIDREGLPTAETARLAQVDRAEGRASSLDDLKWDEALAKAAIEKDRIETAARIAEARAFREASIKWEADNKAKRDALQQSRDDANIGKNYGRGDGYTSQSGAALKDHLERTSRQQNDPRPQHPDEHIKTSVEYRFEVAADMAGRPDDPAVIVVPPPDWLNDGPMGRTVDGKNYNDVADRNYESFREMVYGPDGHENSPQHEKAARQAQEEAERKARDAEAQGPKDEPLGPRKTDADPREFKDGLHERIRRYIADEKWDARAEEHDDDYDPDRQREAPGGGRTRSR